MHRWIAIFFLFLFPLPAVLAAAVPYCQHEKEPASFHIGHHTHEHQFADQADGTDSKLLGMPMAIAKLVMPFAVPSTATPIAQKPSQSHLPRL